jgi:hypothetical protein
MFKSVRPTRRRTVHPRVEMNFGRLRLRDNQYGRQQNHHRDIAQNAGPRCVILRRPIQKNFRACPARLEVRPLADRGDAVGQPIGHLARDLRTVAPTDSIERFPDDVFQFVELDDVGQLAGVRVQPARRQARRPPEEL